MDSFERVDTEALTSDSRSVLWQPLTIANLLERTPRGDAAMDSVGENKFLIFERRVGGSFKSDGYIFDIESNSISQAFDEEGFKTRSWSN